MDAEQGLLNDKTCLLCLDEPYKLFHVVVCTKGCRVNVCPACIQDAYTYGRCLYCKELIDRILDHEGEAVGVRCPKCQKRVLRLFGILLIAKAILHIFYDA